MCYNCLFKLFYVFWSVVLLGHCATSFVKTMSKKKVSQNVCAVSSTKLG